MDKDYWNSYANLWNDQHFIKNLDYGGTGFMIIDGGIFTHPDFFKFNKNYKFVEDFWMSFFIKNKLGLKIINNRDIRDMVKIKRDDCELHLKIKDTKNELLNIFKYECFWNFDK
jgi:hypothetical protein